MVTSLSLTEAQRLALSAQGFGLKERFTGQVTTDQLQQEIDRLALFQIDAINVLARAHLMPLFSRLGHYDHAILEAAAAQAPRRLFEYWGHEAALIDIRLYPAWRWKMADAENHAWARMLRIKHQRPDLIRQVLERVRQDGPLTARDLDNAPGRDRPNWGWNWSDAKTALEWLFYGGQIACNRRNAHFERVYDLPERVIPEEILAEAELSRPQAHRVLALRAVAALGVATSAHAADYFRLDARQTAAAIQELADAGQLTPVSVEGWRQSAWMLPEAAVPTGLTASGLVSPFDSVVFNRRRLAELFGLDYRIEIYTPASKRIWGYYVYLYLLDGLFAARLDLKADRPGSTLLVQAAWREPGVTIPDGDLATALTVELRQLANWLGLDRIKLQGPGDLSPARAAAFAAGPVLRNHWNHRRRGLERHRSR
ncbi:MAG: winged helix DNA-binding domain-containing protein [Bifidobacteriaceae bacterium]|jgi:uncharacterized protein YcaQ|nr:winged helix DNA-binding domain-containing protein [Bifidobacteriaceae bacterium]